MACRPVSERFWEKVEKRGPDDCWPWKAATFGPMGYGIFGHPERKGTTAHRMAYELTHGAIPTGLVILHKCDNPPCCNPKHLIAGTRTDNHNDMVSKNRQSAGRGERHRAARLSSEQVREMRAAYASGETQASLMRRFGLKSSGHIHDIVHGKYWRCA